MQPISDEDAGHIARQFEDAVRTTNVDALALILDKDTLLSQVVANTNIDPKFRRGFITGAKRGKIEKNLLSGMTMGGRIELMRVHDENGEKRALFRIMHADGGLNYWDAILNKDASGQLSVVDIQNYMDGEKLSSQLRRLMTAAAHEAARRSTTDKLFGPSIASQTLKLKEAVVQFQAGNADQALRICKSLPEYLRNEKAVLVLRVQASNSVSEEECVAAIREFRHHYPDDPCIELLMVDYLIMKGEFDEAIEAIDRLDAAVGDVYLNVIRAQLLASAGDLERAKTMAWNTVYRIPKEIDAYWCIATVQMLSGNHRGMTRTMKEIQKRFGTEFDKSIRLPKYAHLWRQFNAQRQWSAQRQLNAITDRARKSFSDVTNALHP